MKDCIFCQIINKQRQADIFYENKRVLVFKDINPKAPCHFLIVPKKHIESIIHLEQGDKDLTADMILTAQKIAKEKGLDKTGYKLLFNVGRKGGQVVDHLHLHLLGGWK